MYFLRIMRLFAAKKSGFFQLAARMLKSRKDERSVSSYPVCAFCAFLRQKSESFIRG